MSVLPLLTWVLVVGALVLGILAGHFGWGKRWPLRFRKMHADYLTGLDYLVTEQPDRALDMFLKLMDTNADTIETHFSLGSLYRRRGEVERAIRIHQNLLARKELPGEHREQALLALAQDYLRAGVLDRAEALLQEVSEVPRLRLSALDALRGVYERQHDWQQALLTYRQLARINAAPPPAVAAHYLCELAALAIERGDIEDAQRLLHDASAEAVPFPRAALLGAQIAEREMNAGEAVRLLRKALTESPALLQEELPHLLTLAGADARDALLAELVEQAQSRTFADMKRLVFAALAAGLSDAEPLRAAIAAVFAEDSTLRAVWQPGPGQPARIAHEIGALLGQAEKYRCNECGFSGRSFYWHCPACHGWDSFEPYAIVKLRSGEIRYDLPMGHSVKTAVFPVAGRGTRFLPVTKASPKEMLPIVDKPLIQYAADEALSAGAETLVFITGSSKRAIEDHFDSNPELEAVLQAQGKQELLDALRGILPSWASCVYIRQPAPLGLGHAVLCARPVVGAAPFMVHLADDLIDAEVPCLKQMVDVWSANGGSVLGVQNVPKQDTDKYGIVTLERSIAPRIGKMSHIVEKPKPDKAASTLAVVGRYLLSASIFDDLARIGKGAGGEIQLTDGIARLMQREPVYAFEFIGKRYDCGSKLGYLQATVEYGLKHPTLGAEFAAYLRSTIPKIP